MAEDMGERTEMPTARRLSEGRERGQTGKSADLSSAITLCGGAFLIWWFASDVFDFGAGLVRRTFEPAVLGGSLSPSEVQGELMLAGFAAVKLCVPLMVLMALIAYAAQVWQVGFIITTQPLEPKLERLNFIAGLGRFFTLRSTVKGGLDMLKLMIIGTVAVLVLRSETDAIVSLAALDLAGGLMESLRITVRVATWVLVILLILGVLDRMYQNWQLNQDLKMTKQEVKDEMRSQEGDMEVKGRRMKFMRGLITQRLQSDVPKADVVVTNPTHYSVAIRYDSATMSAPRVVAKGADYLALKIRYIAAANGVPIIERPPLARALYAKVDVGREVNPEHYEAIAEVLAYVYRLEGKAAV